MASRFHVGHVASERSASGTVAGKPAWRPGAAAGGGPDLAVERLPPHGQNGQDCTDRSCASPSYKEAAMLQRI